MASDTAQPPAETTVQDNGLDVLNAQVERRSRAVPTPRKPRPIESAPVEPAAGERATPTTAGEAPSFQPTEGDAGSPPAGGEAKSVPPAPAASPLTPPRQRRRQPGPPSIPSQLASGPIATEDRPDTKPGEPTANFSVRVRQSLDTRLLDLVHAFRREGLRTSKVEIVELLLWELPAESSPELRRRLAEFRQKAPREKPL